MKKSVRMAQECLAGMAVLGLVPLTLTGAESPASNSLVAFEFLTGETPRRVVIELDEARAPQTCANFRKHVESGYYQGMAVHRVIPNYLVQMGDPYTREPGKKHLWGTGGPDYTVPAELGGKHVRGAVAMARLPDAQNPRKESSGSQFFVTLDDLKQLDGDYTVFGKVVRGIEHLDALSLLTADTNDVPVSRVEIHRTGLGEELRSASLAQKAVKPVAAAAEGLKDVGKVVTSTLPLVGGKDGKEPAPADPAVNAIPPATSEAGTSPSTPAPPPVAAAETEHAKWLRLPKLAPPKFLILGKKKDADPETAAAGEGVAVSETDAGTEEGRKRLLHFGQNAKKSAEPDTQAQTPPAAPAEPQKSARKESTQTAGAEKEKENKEEGEKKGFLRRLLRKDR